MKYIEFDNHMRASFSFAAEEYLMTNKDFNEDYFLFWRTDSCLMIGRFQNTIEEINQDFVIENNTEVTRRNSGGGTIYTDPGCWQFTFITQKINGKAGNFRDFTAPVMKAFEKLGARTEFNSRNDIIVDGRKFSGNAQYGNKNKLCHHGAMLYDTNLDNLVHSLKVSNDKIRSKGIKSVRERVTNIRPYITDSHLDSEAFSRKMIVLIRRDMEQIRFSEKDLEKIQEIEEKKFATWEWNYGQSPEFNMSRERIFAGGKMIVRLLVKKGFIAGCRFYGDFFSGGDISKLETALIGCRYERNNLQEVLCLVKDENIPYMIERDEILDCLID